nr:hypothetical protein [Tanacetum cinerariifolium]
MAQIEKVLSDSKTSSSSADDKISEVSYYLSESESESEYETSEYYDNTTTYGFENPSYFEKAKDLRPSLYDEKVIGLGYTPMFLTHSDEALEIKKFKRARENKIEFAYDYGNTFSSVRRPKNNDVIWKKKGSFNTSNVDCLLAYVCNDAMNVSCNSKMCDLFDGNNLFIFDDESVRISPVSMMPFRKKPSDSMNVRSKSYSNKSLPRTVHRWLPKMQPYR